MRQLWVTWPSVYKCMYLCALGKDAEHASARNLSFVGANPWAPQEKLTRQLSTCATGALCSDYEVALTAARLCTPPDVRPSRSICSR